MKFWIMLGLVVFIQSVSAFAKPLKVTIDGNKTVICSNILVDGFESESFFCRDLPGFLIQSGSDFQIVQQDSKGPLPFIFPKKYEIFEDGDTLIYSTNESSSFSEIQQNPVGIRIEAANILKNIILKSDLPTLKLDSDQSKMYREMAEFVTSKKVESPLTIKLRDHRIAKCSSHQKFPNCRFMECKGDGFEGVLDLQPSDPNSTPMPLLLSPSSQFDAHVKIDSILDDRHAAVFGDRLTSYSSIDYDQIDLRSFLGLIGELAQNQSCDRPIFKHLRTLAEAIADYQDILFDRNAIQVIRVVNDVLQSRLEVHDYEKKKDPDQKIIQCRRHDNWTQEDSELYDRFTTHQGIEPTENEARALFDKVVHEMKDIPFGYTEDGCFARAHVVANRLKDQGYRTGKIWIAGRLTDPSNPSTQWSYHVATVLYVNQGGRSEPRVIDPSPTNKKLLTVDEWVKFNNVQVKPTLVGFPIPEQVTNFGETVISYSSPIPFMPRKVPRGQTLDDSLKLAKETNEKYLKILENKGEKDESK